MEQNSHTDPKITPENVDSLVRDFGKDPEAGRKAALLYTLDNHQSLYVGRAMQLKQSQAISRSLNER